MAKYRFNRPAATDANHAEIVDAYRRLGALVLDIHTLKNCADIIVTWKGRSFYVEIKSPEDFPKYFYEYIEKQREDFLVEKYLTDGERKFREKVLDQNGEYFIIYDKRGVFRSLGLKYAV